MRFEVSHSLTYEYSRPVHLQPHVLRLRPRCDATQRVLQFRISVTPEPSARADCIDLDGNTAVHLWFEKPTRHLEIRSRFAVETFRANPFNFVITHPGAFRLPLDYPEPEAPWLQPYRRADLVTEAVKRFAWKIADEAGREPLRFLSGLNDHLYRTTDKVIRHKGNPYPSERTLSERSGSCRDLAVLFMDACRAVGLAARFVSGYEEGDRERDDRDLHAWAEVYLPGGGWRGFDPSLGLAVAKRHVAVAAGGSYEGAAPIVGAFIGPGTEVTFEPDITMRVFDLDSKTVLS
jgi:transglutaminase-like putative cysteine protease